MNVTYNPGRQSFRFDGGSATPNKWVFDRDSLKWAEFSAETGELTGQGWDFSCKPTEQMVQDWQQVASRYAQIWGTHLDDLDVTLYIRYGDLPKGGRSTNYATGHKEQGVSAYAAKYDIETGAIVFDGSLHGAGTLIYVSSDRTPRLITGQYAGEGSDGEPILRRCHLGEELRYNAEKGGFEIVENN